MLRLYLLFCFHIILGAYLNYQFYTIGKIYGVNLPLLIFSTMFRQLTILCYFLVFSFLSYSQSVEWTPPVHFIDQQGQSVKALNFQGASHDSLFLPVYQDHFDGTVVACRLSNVITEPLGAVETALIPDTYFPAEPVVKIRYGTLRGVRQSIVEFVPIVSGPNGQILKIVSFQLIKEMGFFADISTSARFTAVTNSVLGLGSWLKIAVLKSGIYKIDYAFLSAAGLPVNSLDPRTFKVYGNGGGMLPEPNNVFREADLAENPVWVSGEADGVFNTTDYLLFHARAQEYSVPDAGLNFYTYNTNLYADSAFYFLTFNQGTGLRVQQLAEEQPGVIVKNSDECVLYENDFSNITHSGRLWVGEKFDFQKSYSFNLNTRDIEPASMIRLDISVAARVKAFTSQYVTFNSLVNTYALNKIDLYAFGMDDTDHTGGAVTKTYSLNRGDIGLTPDLKIDISFNNNGITNATGYVDRIVVGYKRTLKLPEQQLYVRHLDFKSQASVTYQISGSDENARVWDVTDPIRPKEMYIQKGENLTFNAESKVLRQFIVFRQNYLTPAAGWKIANQDIHSQNVPDFIIVTHPDLIAAANRLADYRRTKDQMKVLVVTTAQVYNEFSSGALDISAIRDMARFFVKKGGSNTNFKYLLLMGAASYDYKNRIANNTNLVPIYQSAESFHAVESYCSDDYFGMLDDNEGRWDEGGLELIDVGIGRIPAKNIDEAYAVVDKIISYAANPLARGKWRNKITLIADDDNNGLHSDDANSLANIINKNHPQLLTDKLFLDFYVQQNTPVGQYSPDIERDIDEAVNQGSLIVNYSGHGREIGLASENIVTIPKIKAWTTKNNYPFCVNATCDFGRHDDPEIYSGGLALILTPNGGAVGSLTSVRVVYQSYNIVLNAAFYDNAFKKIDGKWPLMGDIIQKTKNASIKEFYNRNYALLGDPTFRLAYAEETAVITKYNNNSLSEKDTISALQKVVLAGEIRHADNSINTNFNGKLSIKFLDKATLQYTRGDEDATIKAYRVLKDVIYDGKAEVKNGRFDFTFVVPKDIAYQFGYGKISLYASNEKSTLDAGGSYDNMVIGGAAKNVVADHTPPLVKLYMNDESFVFGGTTNASSTMLVKLSDESGINIAGSGLGHEIMAVLNENTQKSIVLNPYYSAEGDYTKGTVTYNVRDLPVGNNSLRVKAWDSYNNSGEGYLEFVVANTSDIALNHVLNYPNPFTGSTTFHFDHNRAGDDLDAMVQVYTISGILVKTIHTNYHSSSAHIGDIHWDGKDDFGDKIGTGVYVYKVSLRSEGSGGQTYQYQKLVLLN